ncbi:MAG: Penicillin-binding protein 2D [Microgenomates bacterium OLB23]|nr:MAG: Penicillin-binding protein 2D [Microgenomates bacterium OLB23]
MPSYVKKQTGFYGLIVRSVFYVFFYFIVGLIFIGDLILSVISPLTRATRQVYTYFANLQPAVRVKPPKAISTAQKKPRAIQTATSALYTIQTKTGYFVLGVLVALTLVAIHQGYNFILSLPNPKLIGNVNFPVSTQIYDRNGVLLYDFYKDQNRTPIDIDTLPNHVIQATIAIEDKDFYTHNGVSPVGGILRAIKEMIFTGELQGGSTITQQLVKTSLLSPERTIERKVREAILALWTEQVFSKKEILEMYLNQVPYGGSAYGIEEASKTYFNKSAKDLSIGEAAMLAGLTRAPSKYSPFVNPQLAAGRKNEVLKLMYEVGYLSKDQYVREANSQVAIQTPKVFVRAPHFVFYIKSLLEEQFGNRRIEEGGLRVVTSLDVTVQQEAEKILVEELEKVKRLNISNGAVLITSPSTGEILAMVGSRNYYDQPFGAFNVTTARRQPGSSIKPLLYSLALEESYTAATIINDSPVQFNIAGTQVYRPVNYDGRYHGNVPLRYALANSYNIPAVKTLNAIGVNKFISHAEKLGITTWDTPERYGLSLALGGAEVRMIDMAVAYGVFANYGIKKPLNPIISITDYRERNLELATQPAERVLSEETSFILSDILSDNYARQFAFGLNSDLVIPTHTVAVKTGTTNSKRDNWTIGYNRKFLTAVWVGNNDNSPMNQGLASGVTGASPIWKRTMSMMLEKNPLVRGDVQPPANFNIPANIVTKQCYYGRIEYFRTGTSLDGYCRQSLVSPTPALQ